MACKVLSLQNQELSITDDKKYLIFFEYLIFTKHFKINILDIKHFNAIDEIHILSDEIQLFFYFWHGI